MSHLLGARAVGAAMACLMPSLALSSASQGDPRTQPFRSGTVYVEVDVRITDSAGRPAPDLTVADFVLIEDGRRQTVDRAEYIVVASEPSAAAPNRLFDDPAIASNLSLARPGRVYAIVLDDLLTRSAHGMRLRHAAEQFINRYLAPGDVAAIVYTGSEADGQDFTSDRARLLRAVSRFQGRAADTMSNQRGDAPAIGPATGDAIHHTSRAFRTVRSAILATGRLADVRRTVIWISEGRALPGISPEVLAGRRRGTDAGAMLAAASELNVVIHAIDPSGLSGPRDDAVADNQPPDPAPLIGAEPWDALRGFAEHTGGVAVVRTNDFERGFQSIVDASSGFYRLGYYPTDTSRDNRMRSIDVTVARPGLHVKARS